eukprot:scaffold669974_cov62-Prasinocladus_malaysianus.AAC.1
MASRAHSFHVICPICSAVMPSPRNAYPDMHFIVSKRRPRRRSATQHIDGLTARAASIKLHLACVKFYSRRDLGDSMDSSTFIFASFKPSTELKINYRVCTGLPQRPAPPTQIDATLVSAETSHLQVTKCRSQETDVVQ